MGIDFLVVKGEYQRKGLATFLIYSLKEICIKKSLNYIIVHADLNALIFYEKQGFVKSTNFSQYLFKKYLGSYTNVVKMELDIDEANKKYKSKKEIVNQSGRDDKDKIEKFNSEKKIALNLLENFISQYKIIDFRFENLSLINASFNEINGELIDVEGIKSNIINDKYKNISSIIFDLNKCLKTLKIYYKSNNNKLSDIAFIESIIKSKFINDI